MMLTAMKRIATTTRPPAEISPRVMVLDAMAYPDFRMSTITAFANRKAAISEPK
jgi:hypothetical protein